MPKILLALAAFVLLSCDNDVSRNSSPTINEQQIQCLNKRKEYVKNFTEVSKQKFYRMEEDILLFKTTDNAVVGYLFEQGECSTVLTQVAPDEVAQAKDFVAAAVKKNRGELFITKDNVQFKYYTAKQGADTYLIAQSLN